MVYLLIILFYLISATVDVMDKFLLSTRKIRPLSYAFFSVVTGAVFLLAWPWVHQSVPFSAIAWALFSGALFSVALYVFFKALSEGEASRVIPFIFALVPFTDILLGVFLSFNVPTTKELAALSLLLPAAMLMAFRKKDAKPKHILLKVFSAFLWSLYYVAWQYSAGLASAQNQFMWNRVGSTAVFLLLLLFPLARKNIFRFKQVKNKQHTTWLFLIKQLVGGVNFLLFSFLLVVAKASIVSGLQGFRYLFLFLFALIFSHFHKHILDEEVSHTTVRQKLAAIALIFIGTAILFI